MAIPTPSMPKVDTYQRKKITWAKKPLKKYREYAKHSDRDQEHNFLLSPGYASQLSEPRFHEILFSNARRPKARTASILHCFTLAARPCIGLRDSAIVLLPSAEMSVARMGKTPYASPPKSGDVFCESLGPPAIPLTSDGRRPKCARNRLLKWEELLNPIEYAISVIDRVRCSGEVSRS